MQSFSQRIGKTEIKNVIQLEDIDDELMNALWNGVNLFYFNRIKKDYISNSANGSSIRTLLRLIWADYFKLRIDEQPKFFESLKDEIKQHFFSCYWYEVYDFIEYLPNVYGRLLDDPVNIEFINYTNMQLERELSGYRFVEGKLTPITSSESVIAIENALDIADNYKPVKAHLKRSLELFSDKLNPDYRNSIKESISAIESYCSIITNDPNATLGQALKIVERDHQIHQALKKSFSNLYGYTSNADGIRHALLEEDSLGQEDAQFMLVACSAFIDYLFHKEAKTNGNTDNIN